MKFFFICYLGLISQSCKCSPNIYFEQNKWQNVVEKWWFSLKRPPYFNHFLKITDLAEVIIKQLVTFFVRSKSSTFLFLRQVKDVDNT